MSRCLGCGVELQSLDKNLPGYIPPSSETNKAKYCERCFKIKHHNFDYSIDNLEILNNPDKLKKHYHDYYNSIECIKNEKCLILLLIDILDIYNGVVPNLYKYLGNNPIWVLINKSDLYPKDLKKEKLKERIKKYLDDNQISSSNIYFISAEDKKDVQNILKKAIPTINKKGFNKKNIYVLGSASVGKSTFINTLLDLLGSDARLTTSVEANTTRAKIAFDMGENFSGEKCLVIDTPGYLSQYTILPYLSLNSLKKITPKKYIKERTYQLKENQTIFVDSLFDIDFYTDGLSVTFYVSNELYLHRTKLDSKERIKEFINNSKDTLKFNESELSLVNDKKEIKYSINNERDIYISGIGFIHLKGKGEVIINIPKIIKVESYEL